MKKRKSLKTRHVRKYNRKLKKKLLRKIVRRHYKKRAPKIPEAVLTPVV